MNIFFYVCAAILIVATLPLVLELSIVTSALFIPRRRVKPVSERAMQRVGQLAVVVPAHNEELLVGQCVRSLRASAGTHARILVVAHNCTDATAERAREAGAEVLVYNDADASGKGHALRFGFSSALAGGADAVAVVDSDSTVSVNFIPMIRQAFSEGTEALQCRYEMKSPTDKGNSGLASLAFRGFTFIRPMGRDRLGLSCGILGNGFAITARTLREVPYEAFSLVEDLEYHLHLLRAQKRVRFIEYAVVSAELPVVQSAEVSQRARWEGGRIRVAKLWSGPLLREVLRGRFAMIEPLMDVAGLPLAFGVSALILISMIPLPLARIYGLGSLGLVLMHVLLAAWAGPHFFRSLRLLVMAPFYILWKFRLVPRLIRASHAQAAWIRTAR